MMRLLFSRANSKLTRVRQPLAEYKKLVLLIANHDVPRMRQLMAVQVRAGRSVANILTMVKKAIDGTYKPGGYNSVDLDRSEMCQLIGGARLLFAMQKSAGFASLETVKNRQPLKRFIVSWDSHVLASTVHKNMENFVLPRSRVAGANALGVCVHTLMVDDINMEARRRPSQYHPHMLGYGRESNFSGVTLEGVTAAYLPPEPPPREPPAPPPPDLIGQ